MLHHGKFKQSALLLSLSAVPGLSGSTFFTLQESPKYPTNLSLPLIPQPPISNNVKRINKGEIIGGRKLEVNFSSSFTPSKEKRKKQEKERDNGGKERGAGNKTE